MSIKIWTAYVVKEGQFDGFTDWFRKESINATKRIIRGIFEKSLKPGIELDYQVCWDLSDLFNSSSRLHANPIGVCFGFDFINDEDNVYILPYGRAVNLNTPSWVKDFHYQDSTDPPENIPEDEWRSRQDIWNRIFLDNPHARIYQYRAVESGVQAPDSISITRYVIEVWEQMCKDSLPIIEDEKK